MKVISHHPHAWFLLQEDDRYFLDFVVNSSYASWSASVELTADEINQFRQQGKTYISNLAHDLHYSQNYKDRRPPQEIQVKINDSIKKYNY